MLVTSTQVQNWDLIEWSIKKGATNFRKAIHTSYLIHVPHKIMRLLHIISDYVNYEQMNYLAGLVLESAVQSGSSDSVEAVLDFSFPSLNLGYDGQKKDLLTPVDLKNVKVTAEWEAADYEHTFTLQNEYNRIVNILNKYLKALSNHSG